MAVQTYTRSYNTKLSENFTVSELACKGNGCCTTVKIDSQLVTYLQKIRDHFGKPVNINSGYRCATHNKKVGGASSSYHTKGMAADISIAGVAPEEVAKYAESLGIKGIGLYDTFTHIDTRTGKFFWYSSAQIRRSTFGGSTSTVTPSVSSDGYSVTQFVKDVQKACGATVDGKPGQETLSKTVTISAKKNARHPVVKAVQKRLYALGYTSVGAADGMAGSKFTAALKQFQKDNELIADGEVTARCDTWKELLGMS